MGHYHIFTAREKQNKKLSKKIDIENSGYNPLAVHINKVGHAVHVYGRVVSGARDMNFKIDDSTFALIYTTVFDDFIRYTFSNDGEDEFYLDVFNPSMIDNSELFILIRKADKVVWHWKSTEIGDIYQEYRLLDTYVELTKCYSGVRETLYFH